MTRAASPRTAFLLVAPAVLALGSVTAYPLAHAVWLSFHRLRLTEPGTPAFIGLEAYGVVLTNPLFWRDLGRTLLLVAITVPAELALGLAIALVLHRPGRGRGLARAATLVPYGIVTVVSAYAWRYAFALDTGFVSAWLGLGDLAWFDRPGTALATISVAEIWKTTPFMALLLLAGLATVPDELQEAAELDGATAWQRLWRVTLPAMRGLVATAVLFRALDAYRIFDSVFVMTGGANGTETVSFLAYRQVVTRTALGLGATVSILVFGAMLVLAAALAKALGLEPPSQTETGADA
ncbi:MAG: sugar ABC transporter permease [Anaeromyxobacteraceae bacterium]